MAFEHIDTRRCSICGINRDEIIRAIAFTRSGSNNDYAHTSNSYYDIAWKIIANYNNGKYCNYIRTGASYTDIDMINSHESDGYHQRCFNSIPVAKPLD